MLCRDEPFATVCPCGLYYISILQYYNNNVEEQTALIDKDPSTMKSEAGANASESNWFRLVIGVFHSKTHSIINYCAVS